jgi:hypothetical protein
MSSLMTAGPREAGAARRRVPGDRQRGSRLLPALLAAVSAVAHISQPGRVGSLNAAVATAIAMAEAPEGLSRTTQPFSEPEELTHYSIAY